MNSRSTAVSLRSVEDLADAKDLRAVIAAALTRIPMDAQDLRCAVWTFVGNERRASVPPALIITRLTALIDEAKSVPSPTRLELARQVILWCVEEYFGHLGGPTPLMGIGDVVTSNR